MLVQTKIRIILQNYLIVCKKQFVTFFFCKECERGVQNGTLCTEGHFT